VVQYQALPLSRRFALVCAAAGLTLAIGASFPAHASAASRTSCTVPTRAAKIVSLRLFKSQLAPSRAAFFRGHKRPRSRHKFLVGQQRRLDSLKRAVARCSGASANTAPEALPDPPTPPCSPSLYSAPYTEMNEGTTNAALPLRPGAQIRAVMLFVDFPNLHASESTTAIYNRLVPRSRAWFAEVSYGRAQLDVVPVNQWFRMPRALGDYGLANGISWNEHHDYMADAIHAADPSFDFSPYDIVYVVAAKGTSVERSPAFQSYPGSGIQADGKELRYGATFFEDTKSDARYAANVLIHETGHVLGLPDLYDVPNPTFWSLFRFSGGWDMMSWNDPGLHFLAWEKWKLGWLEPSQLTCLNEPGEVTTTISPLERANGLKAIVVPTGLSSAFVVEARKRIGQDARLCDEGVLVYSVDASVRSGYGPVRVRAAQRDGHGDLFNRCGPLYNAPFDKASGEVARFTDESAGITVHVLSSGAAGYRVRVSRTTFVPQGQPDGAGQASSGASGELAPPQLPFSAISLPFGLGWDLGPPVAD
jgi:M6 family metalloprotease-like protein